MPQGRVVNGSAGFKSKSAILGVQEKASDLLCITSLGQPLEGKQSLPSAYGHRDSSTYDESQRRNSAHPMSPLADMKNGTPSDDTVEVEFAEPAPHLTKANQSSRSIRSSNLNS